MSRGATRALVGVGGVEDDAGEGAHQDHRTREVQVAGEEKVACPLAVRERTVRVAEVEGPLPGAGDHRVGRVVSPALVAGHLPRA